jgi:hypothetical protein
MRQYDPIRCRAQALWKSAYTPTPGGPRALLTQVSPMSETGQNAKVVAGWATSD